MSGNFWVYINEPNNKALIHDAQCSFCNDGHGMDDDSSQFNGKWIGPSDRKTAEHNALTSGKADIRWCGHCARRLDIKTTVNRER